MSEIFCRWTNRETWAVQVHLDNNGELYEITRKAVETLAHLDEESANFILERILQETLEGFLSQSNMPKNYDILKDIGSLWRVDWREIAIHHIKEARA